MSRVSDLIREIAARRRGRKYAHNTIARAARDIVGPTGFTWSENWEQLDRHGKAYVESFDRRLPPSTFVSERDRKRANLPMPLAERCIEDWGGEAPDSSPGTSAG